MNTNIVLIDTAAAVVPTKADIKEVASNIAERVQGGNINPLLALGQLAAIEEIVKQAKEAIKPAALTEAEKYENGGRVVFGAWNCDYQVKETGVKYDYSDNARWQELKAQKDLADAELKSHEVLLKEMKQYTKTSTTSVQVTLRKQ